MEERNEERGPISRRISRVRDRLRAPDTRLITVALLAACVLLLAGLVYGVVLLYEIPDVHELKAARFEQATIVYTEDGEELTRYHDKNRTWIGLDSISTHVVDALIAAEDRRYYNHWGIDVQRTFGAVLKTAGGDKQGGSTITMQLARNAFPDIADDADLTRKFKEWITSLRLEALHDKEDILEMYLNSVPFMYNAFGIEAAARTYFQKPAIELDVDEAATLVGMLKGTVLYNPVRNPERSHERRNVVLQQMVDEGVLDQQEFARLREQPTELHFRRITREDNLAPYFAEHLRQWLDEWADERGYNLYTDGLRVYTTIHSEMQQAAAQAVADVTEDLQAVADVEWSRASPPYFSSNDDDYHTFRQRVDPFAYFWQANAQRLNEFIRQSESYRSLVEQGVGSETALERLRSDEAFVDSVKTAQQRLEAGLIALNPQNGHVKAWVGGRDFGEDQYDHVAQAKRQPGSTFKPFVYATALESGYAPDDALRDEVIEYVDPQTRRRWSPRNVGSASGRMVTLRDALAYSKNTITAKLVLEVGPRRVADYARRMGIRSELVPYPSIGLGTSEVTLLELAGAYTTIANNGRYQEPIFVTRIEDNGGRVLATFSSAGEEVLSSQTSYTLLDMMRGVVDYGTGIRIRNTYGMRGDLAGKTGTSQGGADGWFMLLHPQLVTGAWVGFDTPAISFRSNYWGQGSHTALPIVGEFLRQTDLPRDASFREPPGYRPPVPQRDTMMYAVDQWYDEAYFDSLRRESEALLNSQLDVEYDWEPLEDREEEGDPFARNGPGEETAGSEAASPAETQPDIEELSEADRLNRRERESSSVNEALQRLRERRGGNQ